MARPKQVQTTGCTARKRKNSPSQSTGQWIRPDARLAIYLRDGFLCLVCCEDLHGADPRDITLDHVTPKVDGGSNKPENLYTCCRTCNCSRQDKPIASFASSRALAHITRNLMRPIGDFRKLAKAIIAGETGFEEILPQIGR